MYQIVIVLVPSAVGLVLLLGAAAGYVIVAKKIIITKAKSMKRSNLVNISNLDTKKGLLLSAV